MRGNADCVFLGERSYAVRDQILIVGPPPPGPVGSCARGLSRLEQGFTEVFQGGAVVRGVNSQLVLENNGRAIRMARKPWAGAAVSLALLPTSLEGDAAAISGVLEVEGSCLYVRTPYGDRILPALQTPDTRWDDANGVLHVGTKAFVPGSRVQLGGSFLRGGAPLKWRQAPEPACNQARTWITVAMDPDPGPKVAGYSGEELERLRALDAAK